MGGLGLVFLPLIAAGLPTLAIAILIGLPFTIIFSEYPPERAQVYTRAGALTGFLIPLLGAALIDGGNWEFLPTGLFLGFFGLIAGTAFGTSWGTYREAQSQVDPSSDERDDRQNQTTNRIHDLLY